MAVSFLSKRKPIQKPASAISLAKLSAKPIQCFLLLIVFLIVGEVLKKPTWTSEPEPSS